MLLIREQMILHAGKVVFFLQGTEKKANEEIRCVIFTGHF